MGRIMNIIVLMVQMNNGKTLERCVDNNKYFGYDGFEQRASIDTAIWMKEKYGGEVTLLLATQKPKAMARFDVSKGVDRTVVLEFEANGDHGRAERMALFTAALSQVPFDIILTDNTYADDGKNSLGFGIAKDLSLLHLKAVDNIDHFEFFRKISLQYFTPKSLHVSRSYLDDQQSKIIVKLPCIMSINSSTEAEHRNKYLQQVQPLPT